MTVDLMDQARAEAIRDITSEMLRAAGESLFRHGDDPEAYALLTSATVTFIKEIDKDLLPGFQAALVRLLQR